MRSKLIVLISFAVNSQRELLLLAMVYLCQSEIRTLHLGFQTGSTEWGCAVVSAHRVVTQLSRLQFLCALWYCSEVLYGSYDGPNPLLRVAEQAAMEDGDKLKKSASQNSIAVMLRVVRVHLLQILTSASLLVWLRMPTR